MMFSKRMKKFFVYMSGVYSALFLVIIRDGFANNAHFHIQGFAITTMSLLMLLYFGLKEDETQN